MGKLGQKICRDKIFFKLWFGFSVFFGSVSCTKQDSADSGGLSSITSENAAFALIGVKNLLPRQLPTNSKDAGVVTAVQNIKATFFAPIQCISSKGAKALSAKEKMRQVEDLSAGLALFVDENRQLVSFEDEKFADGTTKKVKKVVDCKLFGPRLVSWDVFLDAFGQVSGATLLTPVPTAPEKIAAAKAAYLLAQTFFLAVRGPFDLDTPSNHTSKMTGRVMEIMMGRGAKPGTIRDLEGWLAQGDPIFNPCTNIKDDPKVWFLGILDAQGQNWKRANYSCDKPTSNSKPRLADYRAGSDEKTYVERFKLIAAFIERTHNELFPSENLDHPKTRLTELLTSLDPTVWSGFPTGSKAEDPKLKTLATFLTNKAPVAFDFEAEFKQPALPAVPESWNEPLVVPSAAPENTALALTDARGALCYVSTYCHLVLMSGGSGATPPAPPTADACGQTDSYSRNSGQNYYENASRYLATLVQISNLSTISQESLDLAQKQKRLSDIAYNASTKELNGRLNCKDQEVLTRVFSAIENTLGQIIARAGGGYTSTGEPTAGKCSSTSYAATDTTGQAVCCPRGATLESQCTKLDASAPDGYPNNSVPKSTAPGDVLADGGSRGDASSRSSDSAPGTWSPPNSSSAGSSAPPASGAELREAGSRGITEAMGAVDEPYMGNVP